MTNLKKGRNMVVFETPLFSKSLRQSVACQLPSATTLPKFNNVTVPKFCVRFELFCASKKNVVLFAFSRYLRRISTTWYGHIYKISEFGNAKVLCWVVPQRKKSVYFVFLRHSCERVSLNTALYPARLTLRLTRCLLSVVSLFPL